MHTSKAKGAVKPGLVLGLACGVQFMVILDLASVNVALPSMQSALRLSQSSLQWIVISYGLTFGGFLLLGGRLADLLGRRRVLVAGLVLLVVGSLSAGLARSFTPLVFSRGLQGLGAALAAPAALSILTNAFAEGPPRNRALGIFGGVGASAASIGLIVSGLLIGGPGWRWIFLINVPIGLTMVAMAAKVIPKGEHADHWSADLFGAFTVTAGLLIAVFAINKSVDYGWYSPTTLGIFAGGLAMLGLFVIIEKHATSPLVPLSVFRLRTLMAACLVAVLALASFFGIAYQISLFMQQVEGYSPIATGLAIVITAASSVVLSIVVAARIVARIGAGLTIVVGQGFAVAGLIYLARVPVHAAYWTDLFPPFLAFGIAIGLTGVAIQVAAFIGTKESVSGLTGGLISTAQEMGAALGIAIIATTVIDRSKDVAGVLVKNPRSPAFAQTQGFHSGLLIAAGLSVAALLVSAALLRRAEQTSASIAPMPRPKAAREAA